MEFSRQEYWSGLPFPTPRNLSDTGIELGSPALQEDSLPLEPWGKCNLYERHLKITGQLFQHDFKYIYTLFIYLILNIQLMY